MSVLHFLESLSFKAHKKGWLSWEKGLPRQLTCPACHAQSIMQTKRAVATPYSQRRRYRLYDCPKCQSSHFPDIQAPPYEDQSHGAREDNFIAPKKFYVEQGAGIDSMIAPFFWVEQKTINSFLEVGCGYGFSLDFAGHALNWDVQGIDPSHIARHGAKELGITIIDGYLDADTELDGMPFDLVYSSEVIEHIADPDPFVNTLAQAAGKKGTVLLTTPDIGGLRPERDVEEIIPLLSPGSHLVLFSLEGLKACLQRAGFAHVQVTSTGDTLYAFASNQPIKIDFSRPIDRKVLSQYLQESLKKKNLPHHLHTGYAGRLLRLQTDAGDYKQAQVTLNALRQHWIKTYKIDLAGPAGIATDPQIQLDFASYANARPFNLVSALYCAGIIALNAQQDQELASACFSACVRSYEIIEPVLTAINASDLDSRNLAHSAALLFAGLIMRTDPALATSTFEEISPSAENSFADQYEKTRLEIFAAAANTGDYANAERLRPAIERTLKNKDGDVENEFDRAAAIGLAMLALNYRFDRADGLFWLQKALHHAPQEQRYEGLREVWLKHAAAHGVELLNHGGQNAFTTKREAIAAALENTNLQVENFAVIEALGIAFMNDQPQKALSWLECALRLSNEAQRPETEARIDDAKTRLFMNAVNAGDVKSAASTLGVTETQAHRNNDPALFFAIGLDALNRRCDMDQALKYFSLAREQDANPEMRIQGAFHFAMVQARTGQQEAARETANTLYADTNPNAEMVAKLIGNRQAELDAAITSAP